MNISNEGSVNAKRGWNVKGKITALLFGAACYIQGKQLVALPSLMTTTVEYTQHVRPTFKEILEASNPQSDKLWRHHYERYYERWLASYRDIDNLRMVEIGAKEGASLGVWAKYFTNPSLILGLAYGASMDDLEKVKSDALKAGVLNAGSLLIMEGDQGSTEVLKKICEKGPYHIIVDDGSHYPPHMVLGFAELFRDCLVPGGLYVIEDLETNYWKKGKKIYGYPVSGGIGKTVSAKDSAVEKFKQLIDVLPRYQLNVEDFTILPGDELICSIEFGMNIMAFHKCTEQHLFDRPETAPFGSVLNITMYEEHIKEARSTNARDFFNSAY